MPWVGGADLVFHAVATGFRAIPCMALNDRGGGGTGVSVVNVRHYSVVTKAVPQNVSFWNTNTELGGCLVCRCLYL